MPAKVRTRVTKNHRVSGDIDPALQEAMMDASRAGFETSMSLVPYGATGELQRGMHEPEVEPSSGNVVWGSSAPHTLPVEYGSVPHWIPLSAMDGLKRWARLVLGDEDAAWAVRQKIAQHGTQPQPFIRPGVERMRARLKGTGVATYIRERIP